MKKTILALLSLPWILSANHPTYNLIVDPYFSPYIGADDLLTVQAGVQYVVDWAVKKPNPPHKGWGPSLERLGELILVWMPYNYLTMVVQHEVFGHGYRCRTFRKDGIVVKKYQFNVPPPYGSGGGATYFHINPKKLTPFQLVSIDSAGVEATAILALRLKEEWLQTGAINAVQTSMYQDSQHDLTQYILGTEADIGIGGQEKEGDIKEYVKTLNRALPKGHLSVQQLHRLAWLNFAEPFTYYAIYAWWLYLITGRQMEIPMIAVGSYRYLPGLRLGLAPYGPEYYLDNFLVRSHQPIYFYLRGGKFAGLRSYGVGFEHPYLWTIDDTPWGLRLDAWLQPNVPYKANHSNNLEWFETYHPQAKYKSRLGIACSLIGHKKLSDKYAIFFQLGGKTTGYLPGETLTPSVIARLGLSYF